MLQIELFPPSKSGCQGPFFEVWRMNNLLLVDLVVVPEETGGLEEQISESMTTGKKRNRSFKNPPLYAKKGSHTLAVK